VKSFLSCAVIISLLLSLVSTGISCTRAEQPFTEHQFTLNPNGLWFVPIHAENGTTIEGSWKASNMVSAWYETPDMFPMALGKGDTPIERPSEFVHHGGQISMELGGNFSIVIDGRNIEGHQMGTGFYDVCFYLFYDGAVPTDVSMRYRVLKDTKG